MRKLTFSINQQNYIVGNIDFNVNKIINNIDLSYKKGIDVAVFPELSIPGYPPEDLVFKPDFIEKNIDGLNRIIEFSKDKDILIIVGFINKKDNIYNSAAVIYNGTLVDIYNKIYLPNYGPFDEKRYFSSGNEIPVYEFKNVRIGINICEDIWYPIGPLHYQAMYGDAEIAINISASPFHYGKQNYREKMYASRAGDETIFLLNCNLVGGQDELVFDGYSCGFDVNGDLIYRAKPFDEDFQTIEIDADIVFRKRLKDIRKRQEEEFYQTTFKYQPFQVKSLKIDTLKDNKKKEPIISFNINNQLDEIQEIYEALKRGIFDYVNKSGFKKVLVAISGGIDSALVATLAVDALGKDNVKGIYLPSKFSSDISTTDANELAKNLGIELFNISINNIFNTFLDELKFLFKDKPFDITEENLQSRIRGNLVMAISNKFNYLVLTTGNKSEFATGYATLYGDMAGGFAVIKDVLKTTVYKLAKYRNSISYVIPERTITRPPTAELRENQKDTDSLPEYEILDRIIKYYVEEDLTKEEIIKRINDKNLVERVINLIDKAEYKRKQSPPGIRISNRAFGKDRRMPIINHFR